jgi:class 3 adenylate cyclase/tetratricopeptide (TPR) repeat protein
LRCGERLPARSRFCPACGTRVVAAPAAERRKVVSVIFADVVGSTALGERVDPETLRWAMQRWFHRMAEAIDRHGGTVENYVGDAVMAVFGVPESHEDDALRAVRAAVEMRDAVAALRGELQRERRLDFAVRIGVNTGEAVTGAATAGGIFTAGDMVNVAARLEQSARPGEILLGEGTFRLVRHAVDADPVAPLKVKGKQAPVQAFRLMSVAPDAPVRPHRPRPPLVDREEEARLLLDAFAAARTERTCRLVTVLGAAGVGKSRLVGEVIDTLDGAATVAAGRCLPYGDGLTWWPLVEALGASGLIDEVAGEGNPAVARAAELLTPGGGAVAPDEAFWAVRNVLESLARRRPLVLVVDDLQWADPVFMDLVEHVANWSGDAPLLLLILARPELLQSRPAWGSDKPNATSIPLEPLADDDAASLLGQLVGRAPLGERAAAHILDVAEGNPLFVVEVVSMLVDDGVLVPGDGRAPADLQTIAVPPTIQALLAARLDRLSSSERTVIEAASIEGKEFGSERVEALVADAVGESIAEALRTLVSKDLIEPFGEDTFRFRHQLIRDAAYDGISKEIRAHMHERFAEWLEAHPLTFPVVDELVGYHLERAVGLRRELGEADAATERLAARASASLGAAGRRAAQRADPSAASALLERAIALARYDEGRAALLPALGAALFEAGRMSDAIGVLDAAIERAPGARWEARARIEREIVRVENDPGAGPAHAHRVVDEVLPVLERAGDHGGQSRAWSLRAQADWVTGRAASADAAWRRAAECTRRSGDERELFGILGWRATAAAIGPTPVDDAIHRCEEFRSAVAASPVAVAWTVNPLATLHAMKGDFEAADRFLREANEILVQLHSLTSTVSHHEALVRMLAGRPDLAEIPLRAGRQRLASMSDRGLLATTNAMLAQAVYAQGNLGEADELARAAAQAAAAEDIVTQVIWRGVKARLLAREGELDEAEALAREAVALVERTDLLSHRADAMLDLADVLRTRSHIRAYQTAARAALSLYERKGNAVGAARALALLNS